MDATTYTAFQGDRRLVTAPLAELLHILKHHHDQQHDRHLDVVIFDDRTGRHVDFDLTGTLDDVLARYVSPAPAGPDRPKLGVTARDVTLLPRHWAWLDEQQGGASAALRRLVDEARKHDPRGQEARRAIETTRLFITAMAGDHPYYEEALRALYARQSDLFAHHTASWASDVRTHAARLAEPAFTS
ncbi:DUF2239 family protein [Deinococcus yavapaiensis]|uniref:DUF2239 family protein n=1 Tax=Deinococcus yavapaiensis KR-236 TaxID=694435 RepID=A0A318S6P2_9DEIO|nr:DUF2239 family protein [Deinococcus yavapaiensis]PYE53883.1 hypothetical protein DES52_107141 [Deinococcus yavapaiensis KR-236]